MGEIALPATRVTLAIDRGKNRRRLPSVVASLVLLPGLLGCVSVVRLVPESFSPSRDVEILLSPPEGRAYVTIARLSTTTVFHDVEAAVDRLVGKARQLGADAIVMGVITDQKQYYTRLVYFPGFPIPISSRDGDNSKSATVNSLKATAIRYTDHAGPQEPRITLP